MDNSPFKNLPAELREEIYKLVLIQEGPIAMSTPAARVDSSTVMSLLSTCAQIREESMPIFLKHNTFELKVLGPEKEPLFRQARRIAGLVERLAPYAKLIQRLDVSFPVFERRLTPTPRRHQILQREKAYTIEAWASIINNLASKLRCDDQRVVLVAYFYYPSSGLAGGQKFELEVHGSDFRAMRQEIESTRRQLWARLPTRSFGALSLMTSSTSTWGLMKSAEAVIDRLERLSRE